MGNKEKKIDEARYVKWSTNRICDTLTKHTMWNYWRNKMRIANVHKNKKQKYTRWNERNGEREKNPYNHTTNNTMKLKKTSTSHLFRCRYCFLLFAFCFCYYCYCCSSGSCSYIETWTFRSSDNASLFPVSLSCNDAFKLYYILLLLFFVLSFSSF